MACIYTPARPQSLRCPYSSCCRCPFFSGAGHPDCLEYSYLRLDGLRRIVALVHVHGGLPPLVAELGLDGTNQRLHSELTDYLQTWSTIQDELRTAIESLNDHDVAARLAASSSGLVSLTGPIYHWPSLLEPNMARKKSGRPNGFEPTCWGHAAKRSAPALRVRTIRRCARTSATSVTSSCKPSRSRPRAHPSRRRVSRSMSCPARWARRSGATASRRQHLGRSLRRPASYGSRSAGRRPQYGARRPPHRVSQVEAHPRGRGHLDADFHAFDWRQSVDGLGAELMRRIEADAAGSVALVAHSMGDVARVASRRHRDRQARHAWHAELRIVRARAGVPWHLFLRRAIAALDLKHSPESLARRVSRHPPASRKRHPLPAPEVQASISTTQSGRLGWGRAERGTAASRCRCTREACRTG